MTTSTPTAGELRQRAAKATNGATEKPVAAAKEAVDAAAASAPAISFLDVLRALAGLALVSSVASYAVTSGDSLVWGVPKPWFFDPAAIRRAMTGPLLLTNDQLAAYDGSDPGKPILLALNRTIYDVTSSPNVYGPGGFYSSLAAKDASRSYITTCFDPIEDLVPYFGGVEEVYVPLWLSRRPPKKELDAINLGAMVGDMFGDKDAEDLIDEVRKKVGRKNVKPLQEKAYARAKERVREQVRTWEQMFEKKGYAKVGRVIGVDDEDPNKWRHLGFCDESKKLRPGMGETLQEAMESLGKGDQMKLNIGKMGRMKGMGGDTKRVKQKKSKNAQKAAEEEDKDRDFKIAMGIVKDDDADDEKEDEKAKAHVKLEDMLKGGKYYPEEQEGKPPKGIDEIIKDQGGDMDAINKALDMLRERQRTTGDVPEAFMDEIRAKDEADKEAAEL